MRLTRLIIPFMMVVIAACQGDSESNPASTGQGGSMTRFAISNNHLYVVDHSEINVFRIDGDDFEKVGAVGVSTGLETIFANGEYLYLGANDAMYIYSLVNPELPSFVFRYSHIVSCDPVVVQGNRAYVTLRNGNACNRGTNALEILDISNPNSPQLISNTQMLSPHGLAVDGKFLFVCEGEYGLKVFDTTDEHQIQLKTQLDNVYAYDVIARDGILYVTGEDGVFQYRYDTVTGKLEILSRIPVTRPEV